MQRASKKWSMNKSMDLSRRVFSQSLHYVLSFYVSVPCVLLSYYIKYSHEGSSFWIFAVAAVMGPAHGTMNAMVYFGKSGIDDRLTTIVRQRARRFSSTVSFVMRRACSEPLTRSSSRRDSTRTKHTQKGDDSTKAFRSELPTAAIMVSAMHNSGVSLDSECLGTAIQSSTDFSPNLMLMSPSERFRMEDLSTGRDSLDVGISITNKTASTDAYDEDLEYMEDIDKAQRNHEDEMKEEIPDEYGGDEDKTEDGRESIGPLRKERSLSTDSSIQQILGSKLLQPTLPSRIERLIDDEDMSDSNSYANASTMGAMEMTASLEFSQGGDISSEALADDFEAMMEYWSLNFVDNDVNKSKPGNTSNNRGTYGDDTREDSCSTPSRQDTTVESRVGRAAFQPLSFWTKRRISLKNTEAKRRGSETSSHGHPRIGRAPFLVSKMFRFGERLQESTTTVSMDHHQNRDGDQRHVSSLQTYIQASDGTNNNSLLKDGLRKTSVNSNSDGRTVSNTSDEETAHQRNMAASPDWIEQLKLTPSVTPPLPVSLRLSPVGNADAILRLKDHSSPSSTASPSTEKPNGASRLVSSGGGLPMQDEENFGDAVLSSQLQNENCYGKGNELGEDSPSFSELFNDSGSCHGHDSFISETSDACSATDMICPGLPGISSKVIHDSAQHNND